MHADNFQLDTYLARIGHTGPVAATLATLSALMRQQLFTVPFENLDVQAGKGVSLVPEHIVSKILGDQRGGYCYEVNGLFAMALQAIGLPYRMVAARPMFYPARRPKTHMALVVQAEGAEWLCDLGFGSYGIRAPMSLSELDVPVAQHPDTFRLSRNAVGEYLLQALVQGEWANQYGFDLSPCEWVDFMPANWMNSTHPDAIFVQKRVVVRHHPEGRDILLGDALKTVRGSEVLQRTLAEAEIAPVLRDTFGLVAPAAA
ncbi:MAG: hypothetical protein RJA98_128, partial [Pseudomonadota bacterium]|jgi:N-hydroxyarylamine O-acetyltransferase